MLASLNGSVGLGGTVWTEEPARLAHGGWTELDLSSRVDAWVTASPIPAAWAFIGIGVNYIGTISEADYKTRIGYVLDAIHTAWPNCKIRLTRVWRRNYDTECNTLATWQDDLIAARSGWATPPAAGDDERVWMKGADNGATMSSDGTHYSTAGMAEKAAQVKALMGY